VIAVHHGVGAHSFQAPRRLPAPGPRHALEVLPRPPRLQAKAHGAVNAPDTVPARFDGERRLAESAAICR